MRDRGVSGHVGFCMIDATSGAAITSGVSGLISIDNSNQVAVSGTLSHKGNGQWVYSYTAAEADCSAMHLLFSHASANPVHMSLVFGDIGAAVYRSIFGADPIYVRTVGNDANSGEGWLTAKQTIQGAIDAASGDGAHIIVAPGTYSGAVDGTALDGVTLRGCGPSTIITHDGSVTLTLDADVGPGGNDWTVRDLTLANTRSPGSGSASVAFINASARTTWDNVLIQSLQAGIDLASVSGAHVFSRCRFQCGRSAVDMLGLGAQTASLVLRESQVSLEGWSGNNRAIGVSCISATMLVDRSVITSTHGVSNSNYHPVGLSADSVRGVVSGTMVHAAAASGAFAIGIESVGTGTLAVLGTHASAGTTANALDLKQSGTAVLAVGESHYVAARTSGTITLTPDVQAGLGAQGYSAVRAIKLDNLDAAVSTAGGATAEAVWTYAGRTLTQPQPTHTPTQQRGRRAVIRGDSFGAASRSFLVVYDGVSEWPADLGTWSWTFTATKNADNRNPGDSTVTGSVSVVTATGASRTLRVSITASALSTAALGLYDYMVRGTLGSNVWTVETGVMRVET